MGEKASDTFMNLFKLNNVSQNDAIAISKLFSAFQAENPVPDNISGKIESIVSSLQSLKEMLEEVKISAASISDGFVNGNMFNFDTTSFDEAIPKLTTMIDLFTQMNKSFTLSEIEDQWTKVRSAFNKITTDAFLARGSKKESENQKKQFEEFEREYNKYLKMGGAKKISKDLKYDKDENYSAIQEEYVAQVEKANGQIGKSIAETFNDSIGTAGVDGANQWRDSMLAAIESVKSALQGMFKIQSESSLFNTLKGWRDADRIMRNGRGNTGKRWGVD